MGENHVPAGEGGYKSGFLEKQFDYWYAGHNHLQFYPKKNHEIFANAKADTQIEIIEEGVLNFLDPNEEFYTNAVHFLDRRPKDKPFCLSVCFNVPHDVGTGSMLLLPEDPDIYKSLYRDLIDVLPLSKACLNIENISKKQLEIADFVDVTSSENSFDEMARDG